MLLRICRLCPNTEFWKRPTQKFGENKSAYTSKFGFGFEEWLNREEWLLSGYPDIDGVWRYVHIQGLLTKNNAYEGEQVKVLFYVKEPNCEPQAVGILENAFVIDEIEATWAAKQFAQKGWLHVMHAEVLAIGGKVEGLPPIPTNYDELTWAKPLFYANVRFRPGSLRFFDERKHISVPSSYYGSALKWGGIIPGEHYHVPPVTVPSAAKRHGKQGAKALGRFSEEIRKRREASGKDFLPRQAPIQNALAVQLDDFYGPQNGIVTCEDDKVDIKFVAPDGTISFIEIKPASTARQSIRQALGQLIEYSHYPDTNKAHRMVIVSDVEPLQSDLDYLAHIHALYGLPVRYVYWPSQAKCLSENALAEFVAAP